MHFSQLCTHERCKGYWALRFDEGSFGTVSLSGTRAVIVFDTPQRMIDGGWTQILYIDTAASGEQRTALETILTGGAGGPWEKLAQFVGQCLPTEYVQIQLDDEGATKRVSIAARLKSIVTQIRGRDKSKPVLFENSFNQIHAPRQVLALGDTTYDDGTIRLTTAGTHGLFSAFDWAVETRA